MLKDKADRFDTMIVDEEKIRLGEAGWKTRCVRDWWMGGAGN